MATKRIVILLIVVFGAAASFALGDPAVKGIALCRQPWPGDRTAYQRLQDLAIVTLPNGKPVRLFPKIPASIPPTFGAVNASLLDEGRLVLVDAAYYASDRKHGFMALVFNPATGKLTTLTTDAVSDSVVVSPDRKTVKYSVRGSRALRLWHTDGHETRVTPPKGYEYSVKVVQNARHLILTQSRGDEKRARHFWLNESRGTLTPIAPSDPWLKAEAVCSGRYVYVDGNWDLWLVGPGKKTTKLARLEVDGEPPENVWCTFSPDGRFLICCCGRSAGEPHFAYDDTSYYFDLRGAAPVLLRPPRRSCDGVSPGGFIGWYSVEGGVLHTSVWDLLWTEFPSLKTRKIATLPGNCEFIDFVRRDEPSARGNRN